MRYFFALCMFGPTRHSLHSPRPPFGSRSIVTLAAPDFGLKHVHFMADEQFITGSGTKVQGLKSPFLRSLATFTPIASYRHVRAFRFAIG